MNKQAGLSLSEVLISLFLTSVMITPLLQFYVSSKFRYLETEKILTIYFDLQWVSNLLSDSIRRAGFTPCLGLNHLQIIDHRHLQHKINALQIGNPKDQFLQINRMDEHFAKVINIRQGTQILMEHALVLHKKRPVIIADCEHAEIHELAHINQQTEKRYVSLSQPLFFSYDNATYIGEYLEEQWYIKKNAKQVNTLHYKLVQTEEISPVIHSLQIQYDQQMLQLIMGLEEGKTQKLRVAVRGL
jgi:hypothetical protein